MTLEEIASYIDWTPFFHTWELRGVYPRSSSTRSTASRRAKLFAEANALLDEIIAKKLLTARGVYGFFPANAVGDDVELYTDETRTTVLTTFHFLRQQMAKKDGEPHRSLADFIAPQDDRACRRSHRGASR